MKKVLEYTTGSKMFGLDTEESDIDMIWVYLDPNKAINPSSKTTEHVESEGYDTDYIEMATFLRGIIKNDLKYIEAIMSVPKMHLIDTKPLKDLVRRLNLNDMYIREITRRFNKTWTECNPANKNYNKKEGYDSKYAAHFFRVLISSRHYINLNEVCTDFTGVRDTYLGIKNGEITKEAVYDITNELAKEVIPLLNKQSEKIDIPFPTKYYFDLVNEHYIF